MRTTRLLQKNLTPLLNSDTEIRKMPDKDLKSFLVKIVNDLEEDMNKQMNLTQDLGKLETGENQQCGWKSQLSHPQQFSGRKGLSRLTSLRDIMTRTQAELSGRDCLLCQPRITWPESSITHSGLTLLQQDNPTHTPNRHAHWDRFDLDNPSFEALL